MKKVLITGGNGNIGVLIADQLLALGMEVVKFDIPGTEPASISEGETVAIGDIRDTALLESLIKQHQPDTIYHLASLLSGSSEADPTAAWEINASSSFQLLRLAHEHSVNTFFFASTLASYGEDLPDPMPEDTQQWPTNIYGVTKVAVERLGVYYKLKHGMDFRCLRFPLVFSPFAPAAAVTAYPSHAVKAACANQHFTFPVSPSTGTSSMLLNDVVDGIVTFTQADKSKLKQHAYSLHGFHVTAEEVALDIKKRLPSFSYEFKPQVMADTLIANWPNIITDQSARDEWGWQPKYDFLQSIDHLMQHFKGADKVS